MRFSDNAMSVILLCSYIGINKESEMKPFSLGEWNIFLDRIIEKHLEPSVILAGDIKQLQELGYGNLPICIAKTQYSLSDDPKNLECNNEYDITVRNVELKTGASFVVVLAGKIMTMPGLPRVPAAEAINVDEDGIIEGIF